MTVGAPLSQDTSARPGLLVASLIARRQRQGFCPCELHWPTFSDLCARNGHPPVDIAGDLRALAAEFPRWRVFTSDGGRLYASRTLRNRQGITVDAYLVTDLRTQMCEIEDRNMMAGHARDQRRSVAQVVVPRPV
jgi:hypothetical protein